MNNITNKINAVDSIKNGLKTINGQSVLGDGDIVISSSSFDPTSGAINLGSSNSPYPNYYGTAITIGKLNSGQGINIGWNNTEPGGNHYINASIGSTNSSSGYYGSILGSFNYKAGTNQTMTGVHGSLKSDSRFVHANGPSSSFSANPNVYNQVGWANLKTTTSGSVSSVLLPNAGGNNGWAREFLLIDTGTSVAFEGTIVGNIAGGESVSFKIEGLVRCGATVTTCVLVNSTVTPKFSDVSLNGCSVSISARSDANYLEIRVTGVAGKTISWNGFIFLNEVR